MGESVDKQIKRILEDYGRELYENAVKKAKYKLVDKTNDYLKNKLQSRLNAVTGHPHMSSAIYPVFEWKSAVDYDIGLEYDPDLLGDIYASKSGWHQSGNTWTVVSETRDISASDYLERMHSGLITYSQHGAASNEWLMENFMEGREYWTNGWPFLSSDDVLKGAYVTSNVHGPIPKAKDVAAKTLDLSDDALIAMQIEVIMNYL